jgi:quinol-cytochrome oxidoreductase complex cytochrome b subunit
MTFYYKPTVAEAYSSVQYLMTDVSFGWLIRSVHRWSASMMVLMLIFTSSVCTSQVALSVPVSSPG